jgi:putative flavoprotein involved in K+ transport
MSEHVDTVVIGGGQAGLAAGYHLQRSGVSFVILDRHARVGDAWRERYDSLRLFTPAHADNLPGLRFPGPRHAFPGKDAMADYLESYARHFALPVRSGVRATRIDMSDDGFVVTLQDGSTITAYHVVVASGGHARPRVPEIAEQLRSDIVQLHAADYRNPGQLPEGPVLVVGASHSGADLALEARLAGHPTILSGRFHGELPIPLEGRRGKLVSHVLPLVFRHLLTLRTPMGRKAAPQVRAGGALLLRVKSADLGAAGVEHTTARTVGVQDGLPVLDDGRVVECTSVLWCTGYVEDFSWVTPAAIGDDGFPLMDRGASTSAPGLYFVGLPFQYAFASAMVNGVGRDAAWIARRIAARRDVRRADREGVAA